MSIGALLSTFATMRKSKMGPKPNSSTMNLKSMKSCHESTVEWFTQGLFYLSTHWPTKKTPYGRLLQDYMLREFCIEAYHIEKTGGQLLRQSIFFYLNAKRLQSV